MDGAQGVLTPPPSPLRVGQSAELWFPKDVTVLSWNIKFNKKPLKVEVSEPAVQATEQVPTPTEEIANPTQVTKGIVAATLVILYPELFLVQEAGWAPKTGPRASSRTWVQRHLVDEYDRLQFSDEYGKTVLENYGFSPGKAIGPQDVYIMYRKDKLQEVKAKVHDKSLMQYFSELLLEEFKGIMKRLPQVNEGPKTRTKHIEGLTSALKIIFKKILGRVVCTMLQSKTPPLGQHGLVTFLAMSVHMPYKGYEKPHIAEFGRATLNAACILARTTNLPLICGGDWNIPVSMVHGANPKLYLLNRDHDRIDGVFMFCDETIQDPIFLDPRSYADFSCSETYKWKLPQAMLEEASEHGGDAAALVKFCKFACYCYMYESNHMPILVNVPRFGTLPGSKEMFLVDLLKSYFK